MRTLLLLLCSAFGCFAQGFSLTGNAFAHLTVRPPNCWVDVMQFINTNAPDFSLATNLVDFSGHGLLFSDDSQGLGNAQSTNIHYMARFGGVLGACCGAVSHMSVASIPNAQVLVLPYTNRCTIAMRYRFRAQGSADHPAQTGETGSGTSQYADTQILNGTIYFDFSNDAGGRISKAQPADMTDNLVNVFFIHGGTNSSIWMGGPTGPITNWHSALCTGLLTNTPPTARFSCMGGGVSTNYYIKRILWWDYDLKQADIEYWNWYMSYLP